MPETYQPSAAGRASFEKPVAPAVEAKRSPALIEALESAAFPAQRAPT